jgi:hypothetical protein
MPVMNMYVVSVGRLGDCVNVEIGYEEEVALTIPNETMQHVVQLIRSIFSTKRRVTKAVICLTEEEYEVLRPTVGDEVEIRIDKDNATITFKFIK